jgi:pyridoxamine 5'-phosphate oxidase
MQPETTADPLELLESWLREAESAGLALPESMTLATVGPDGRPSARVVLYKGLSEGGLRFFTNYQSRKGQELAQVKHAALVFHWAPLERQVRVEGTVEKLSAEESDAYFATRPRESQLGAWASPQSEPIASREELERRVEELAKRYEGGPVPRPPHWGGYRVVPERVEVWVGRGARLHDRFRFTRGAGGWSRERLAP